MRTYTLLPLHRPAGRVKVQLGPKDDPEDIFKDRASWLLEALNAGYSHRAGYHLSPARAAVWERLYRAGFNGRRRISIRDKRPVTFSLPDGPELSLKDALAVCDRLENPPDPSICPTDHDSSPLSPQE